MFRCWGLMLLIISKTNNPLARLLSGLAQSPGVAARARAFASDDGGGRRVPGGSAGEASARGRRGRRAHLGELRARPGVPRRGRGLGPRAARAVLRRAAPSGPRRRALVEHGPRPVPRRDARERPPRPPPDPPPPPRVLAPQVCLGCAVPFPRASVASHAREASHLVFADADRAELFCAACDSHAYAPAFDRAVLGARAIRAGITGDVPPTRAASRPSDDDDDDDASPRRSRNSNRTRRRRRRSPSPLNASGVPRGVRGVANLGATCFMSSVLQAITRDPICARFFLSDGHDAARCAERRANRALDAHRDGLQVRPEDDHCLACELDALINAAFADGDVEAQKEPLVPAAFLHAWWRHAPEHLARYGQQDAHEFFLALAQAIHAAAVGPEESEKRTSEEGARVGGVPTINDAREENDDAKRGEVGGEANASAAGPGGVSAGAAGGAAAKEWRIPGNDATERTKSPRARPDGVGRAPPGRGRLFPVLLPMPHAPRVRRDASLGRHLRRVRARLGGARPDRRPEPRPPDDDAGARPGGHAGGVPAADDSARAAGRGRGVRVRRVRRRRRRQVETDGDPGNPEDARAAAQAVRAELVQAGQAPRSGRFGRERRERRERVQRVQRARRGE